VTTTSAPKTAIVIDDMKSMRGLAKVMLKSAGVEVVGEAENGEEGFKLYKSVNPDLVLLDIEMPVMDGMRTLSKILGHDPNAKVVMLTTVSNWNVTEACIHAGAMDYIHKDKDPAIIKQRVEEVLASL
tara:strand:- start:281 stop:664 length:384 start_codon:yes stop_codon:yes gene_type:complete